MKALPDFSFIALKFGVFSRREVTHFFMSCISPLQPFADVDVEFVPTASRSATVAVAGSQDSTAMAWGTFRGPHVVMCAGSSPRG